MTAKDAFTDRLRRVAGWSLLAAVALAAGCAPESAAPASFSAANQQDDAQFQAAANRPPTAKTLYAVARILATQGRDAQCEFVLKRTIRHPQTGSQLPASVFMAPAPLRRG